jgi:hypothetical protein
MDELLVALQQGTEDLSQIPNLLWKSGSGVRQNRYEHKPASYGIGIDWTDLRQEEVSQSMPIQVTGTIKAPDLEFSNVAATLHGGALQIKHQLRLHGNAIRIHPG